jgi:hypothetical protein
LLNSASKNELVEPVEPDKARKTIEKIKMPKSVIKLAPTPKVSGPVRPSSGLGLRLNQGMKSV